MKVYDDRDKSKPGYDRPNNSSLLRDLGHAKGMFISLGIEERDVSLTELVEYWQQEYGGAICDTMNEFDTGRNITIEDIPNFKELSIIRLRNLLLHTRRTASYAHSCFAKGSGYGVNIDINLLTQLRTLFKLKGISINIFTDRDVSSYCTIVYDRVDGVRALTHREILSGEGLSKDEIKVSFTEQTEAKRESMRLETMEKELHFN